MAGGEDRAVVVLEWIIEEEEEGLVVEEEGEWITVVVVGAGEMKGVVEEDNSNISSNRDNKEVEEINT